MKKKNESRKFKVKRGRNGENRSLSYRRKLFPVMILITSFVIMILAFPIHATTVDEILSNVNSHMILNDTLSETITMKMEIRGMEKTERIKLYQKGPKKLRIENLDKTGNMTIINGGKMLIKKGGKEVLRQSNSSKKSSLIPSAYFVFNPNNIKEKYNIAIKEDRRNTVVLHLVPKRKGKYNSIDMVVNKGEWRIIEQRMSGSTGIAKMEIGYDKVGNISRIKMDTPLPHGGERGAVKIEYTDIKRGKIDDHLFDIGE